MEIMKKKSYTYFIEFFILIVDWSRRLSDFVFISVRLYLNIFHSQNMILNCFHNAFTAHNKYYEDTERRRMKPKVITYMAIFLCVKLICHQVQGKWFKESLLKNETEYFILTFECRLSSNDIFSVCHLKNMLFCCHLS